MFDSITAPINRSNATIPISSRVGKISRFRLFRFNNLKNIIALLEIAIPYENISRIPNGVIRITKGEIWLRIGLFIERAWNTLPVLKPENNPKIVPSNGTNINNDINKLFINMPT